MQDRNEPVFVAGLLGPTDGLRTRRALLCDRDGTLIENQPGYVLGPRDIQVLPGAAQALEAAAASGYPPIIVSNQSAVGRGLIALDRMLQVHADALRRLDAERFVIGNYFCPHTPDEGCDCRKPAPGMLLRAVDRFGLEPGACVYVGDAVDDARAALAAGMRAAFVRTGRGREQEALLLRERSLEGVAVYDNIAAAVAALDDEWPQPRPLRSVARDYDVSQSLREGHAASEDTGPAKRRRIR